MCVSPCPVHMRSPCPQAHVLHMQTSGPHPARTSLEVTAPMAWGALACPSGDDTHTHTKNSPPTPHMHAHVPHSTTTAHTHAHTHSRAEQHRPPAGQGHAGAAPHGAAGAGRAHAQAVAAAPPPPRSPSCVPGSTRSRCRPHRWTRRAARSWTHARRTWSGSGGSGGTGCGSSSHRGRCGNDRCWCREVYCLVTGGGEGRAEQRPSLGHGTSLLDCSHSY